ncbi:uncharacterized protein LOC119771735 [Cyprinodon tularosa]|uniref:uncharacterized protein LOC119771735 n=1 Tax=Cyprinodon tularosa TaxID=77115 RepID=UPI0018E284CF|nr:uncharacterized protein LOC119771735 [Cyprinodon tularosa]
MAASMTGRSCTSLVWTDDEVELLLRVTLDYKVKRLQESVDWETCHSKYSDIMSAFQEQYPRDSTDRDFPHDSTAITKAQLTAKIKNIRGKYRAAVDSGRKSGFGRVVLLFFELCEEIWGGSPATRSIESGVETADLDETSTQMSETSDQPADSPQSAVSAESVLPSPVIKQRRQMLQAKLNSHRGDRLKRRTPTETAEEDIQIKRRMLELMEQTSRRNQENIQQINTNIANITNTIQDGFSLLRELLLQPPPARHYNTNTAYGHFQGHQQSHLYPNPPSNSTVSHTKSSTPLRKIYTNTPTITGTVTT